MDPTLFEYKIPRKMWIYTRNKYQDLDVDAKFIINSWMFLLFNVIVSGVMSDSKRQQEASLALSVNPSLALDVHRVAINSEMAMTYTPQSYPFTW